jgi:hypothetical protein
MSPYNIIGLIFIISGILAFLGRKKSVAFQMKYLSTRTSPDGKKMDEKILLLRNYLGSIAVILVGIYLLLFK